MVESDVAAGDRATPGAQPPARSCAARASRRRRCATSGSSRRRCCPPRRSASVCASRGVTVAHVRRELYERRTLVKTWSIRGTLHLVPGRDELPLWAAAVRGPKPFGNRRMAREARRDAETGCCIVRRDADVLTGRCLTRAELAEEVAARLGWGHEKLKSAWGEFLSPPGVSPGHPLLRTATGRQLHLRSRGRMDSCGWSDVDGADARREALRRYLRAHGPAKVDDLRRWSGSDRDVAAQLFDEIANEVEQVRVERARAWPLRDDVDYLDREPEGVRLLPQYDAYIIGFLPRDPPARARQSANQERSQGTTRVGDGNGAGCLVDGVVTGFWRRSKTKSDVSIDVEHVLPLPKIRRGALDAAVENARDPELVVVPVLAGVGEEQAPCEARCTARDPRRSASCSAPQK